MDAKTIQKAGGILIKDGKFLLERHGGNDIYIIPGGKREANETAAQALVRELHEEFALQVHTSDLRLIGNFDAPAVHNPQRMVSIETFLVEKWSGELTLHDGIEAIVWINAANADQFQISAIAKQILPVLVKMGLID